MSDPTDQPQPEQDAPATPDQPAEEEVTQDEVDEVQVQPEPAKPVMPPIPQSVKNIPTKLVTNKDRVLGNDPDLNKNRA